MRIVLAPDSFKECLTAAAVCTALRQGVLDVFPDADVVAKPMADGGEGTVAVLQEILDGAPVTVPTTGPLGGDVEAVYWYDAGRRLAVIESAAACGLPLVPVALRNPMLTSTRGVGTLVADAFGRGAEHLLLTIGGSATVDGGTGLAKALGYRFLNDHGDDLAAGGGSLTELAYVAPPVDRPWLDRRVEVVCDVDNPLLGERGAARVFAPQKGADAAMVELLDMGLANLAAHVKQDLGVDIRTLPGAGAAGGMGGGLAAFLGARLVPGSELIARMTGLAEAIAGADLVITGEGRTDAQSAGGKVCAGVARIAGEQNVPCVVLAGAVEGDLTALQQAGVTAVHCITPAGQDLETAMRRAPDNLAAAAASVVQDLLG